MPRQGLGLAGALGTAAFSGKLEDILAERELARLKAEAVARQTAQTDVENRRAESALQLQRDQLTSIEKDRAERRTRDEESAKDAAQREIANNFQLAVTAGAPGQDLTEAAEAVKGNRYAEPVVKGLRREGAPSSLPSLNLGATTAQGEIPATGIERGIGVRLINPKLPPAPVAPASEPLEDVIDPKTNKPVKLPRSQAAGMQPFVREGNDRLVPVEGPDGKPVFVRESEAAGLKPATPRRSVLGAERVALGFYNRMSEAMADMDATEDLLSTMDMAIIHDSPSWLALITNPLLSNEGQRYAQALKKFTEARLRKESGAAIPISEFKNDRDMIARKIGDRPEVIAQKRATREQTADGIAFQAGQAYEEFYGEAFKRRSADDARGQSTSKGFQVGQTVMYQGKPHKVVSVNEDGTLNLELIVKK